VPHSDVLVLNRHSVTEELEASTPVDPSSPLHEPLQSAAPRVCLAVRPASTYDSRGDPPPLLSCELCGSTTAESTCVPLLVSGEVIGSVLVSHDAPLAPAERRRVNESVAQAAPTLANLRTIALAEARASTDALTGLPNRRAIGDTVKRLVAQATRTAAPLAALVLDVDHFKQVNDLFGHDRGDEALAAVGEVIAAAVRAGDFAGRSGGEEFVVLLPDTDAEGGHVAAEKLRAAIATVTVPGVDRNITASIGVAAVPDHAADSETLLRAADRALYAAKANGRNRVERAVPPDGHVRRLAA
jgi:diguanylate cyclase (GGDEF)-like protein